MLFPLKSLLFHGFFAILTQKTKLLGGVVVKRLLCVLILSSVILLCGCQTESRETVFAMDTVMDLQVWGADSEKAVSAVKALILDMEDQWSAQKLNQEEIADDPLLDSVQQLSVRTDGAFNPKLYSLMKLWGFSNKEYYVPTEEEIATAMAEPLWDLGGAVKGYTGQKAAELLQKLGADRAILNLGGNIQTYGNKPNGEPWSIGIQDPDGGGPVAVVQVNGTVSVVTSGDYQRYFEKDGVRYHHILDPKTGKPAETDLRSVTIISRDGLTADALSTALFVMGLEQGSDFWRESDDFEAVFLTKEGKLYATEGVVMSGCEYEVIRREN